MIRFKGFRPKLQLTEGRESRKSVVRGKRIGLIRSAACPLSQRLTDHEISQEYIYSNCYFKVLAKKICPMHAMETILGILEEIFLGYCRVAAFIMIVSFIDANLSNIFTEFPGF